MILSPIKKDTTSKLIRFSILNAAANDGSGLTSLSYSAAGLSCCYLREGATATVAISLVTMTVGTWISGGFKEIDSVNMPVIYELGIPNAALVSGANSVKLFLKGAANMVPTEIDIPLESVDRQNAVNFGLSAIPIDLTQTIPTNNTSQTVGDALNAARAQGFGKWVLSGTTLTLYAADGTTAVRVFALDKSSGPTSRS
jgi:hypothetical protein